jgi:hypothetical protein
MRKASDAARIQAHAASSASPSSRPIQQQPAQNPKSKWLPPVPKSRRRPLPPSPFPCWVSIRISKSASAADGPVCSPVEWRRQRSRARSDGMFDPTSPFLVLLLPGLSEVSPRNEAKRLLGGRAHGHHGAPALQLMESCESRPVGFAQAAKSRARAGGGEGRAMAEADAASYQLARAKAWLLPTPRGRAAGRSAGYRPCSCDSPQHSVQCSITVQTNGSWACKFGRRRGSLSLSSQLLTVGRLFFWLLFSRRQQQQLNCGLCKVDRC